MSRGAPAVLAATALLAALAATKAPTNGGFVFLAVLAVVCLASAFHLWWESDGY